MKEKINDGGPAYPTNNSNADRPCGSGGMTLRDYFAAAAMQGLLASFGEQSDHRAAIDFGSSDVAALKIGIDS